MDGLIGQERIALKPLCVNPKRKGAFREIAARAWWPETIQYRGSITAKELKEVRIKSQQRSTKQDLKIFL